MDSPGSFGRYRVYRVKTCHVTALDLDAAVCEKFNPILTTILEKRVKETLIHLGLPWTIPERFHNRGDHNCLELVSTTMRASTSARAPDASVDEE